MNILLTGATGFIGRYITAGLLAAGHHVVPAVRRPADADRLLPAPAAIAVDFNRDTRLEDWLPRLAGIDAVVNCAGVLHQRPGQSIEAIHVAAPKALFAACAAAGVRRVIHISAISAEDAAGTPYATTKRQADEGLAATDLDWVILRPSLVYADGAYGGTALFRAIAALPFAIPVVGKGNQVFQPIHVADLVATIVKLLDDRTVNRMVIDPVGPDRLTLRQILVDLRRWLGYAPAPVVQVPMGLVEWAAHFGNWFGGPINVTALRQLAFGNAGALDPFVAASGIRPRPWTQALLTNPSQAQDRWHARLYFVRPLLRWTLAVLWIASAIVGILQPSSVTTRLLADFGVGPTSVVVLWASCILDLAIALALLARWRPGVMTMLQLAVVAVYTVGLTVVQPGLWTDPFGPLLKNLPIVATILALGAIESDR